MNTQSEAISKILMDNGLLILDPHSVLNQASLEMKVSIRKISLKNKKLISYECV